MAEWTKAHCVFVYFGHVMIVIRNCIRCGLTEFTQSAGQWYCKPCRVRGVTERRRRLKSTLVDERGGSCEQCGYDKSLAALAFHHIDPSLKSFEISRYGKSLERLRNEAAKCKLLCHNCHAEEEERIRIDARVVESAPLLRECA